jgi:excisionase family DNA binding protein
MIENDLLSETYYSVRDIAESLKVEERVVRGLLKRGQLRGVKVGKEWRIPASALKAFLNKGGQ